MRAAAAIAAGVVVLGFACSAFAEGEGADAGPTSLVPPTLLHFVEASYPLQAIAAGVQGDVVMDLDIDGEGRVSSVRVRQEPGAGLGDAAATAARQFVFSPASLDGRVRAVTIEYTYQFRLAAVLSLDGGAANDNHDDGGATLDAGMLFHVEVPDAGVTTSEAEHRREVALGSTVEAPAPTSAASAETVRDRDLVLRPHATPEDILRVVPGLVIAQHQGGGKADQLFLRGFDADHGTDVAIFIDDVPVNMPSHGHGQGFADLHFLIPEVIDRIDVSKGPYFPEYGDFDTAGAINLHTRRSFGESSLQGTYGSFETYRVLGVASSQSNATLPWLAAEVSGTQGPFQFGEELQRYNVFSKETLQLDATTRVSALISLYGSQWRSSGQLPLDAVEDNTVDRFGSLDPTEGGQTQRQMLVLSLEHRPDIDQLFRVTAYGVRYQVALFSDFTFALRDPVNLDEIEQDDARTYTGLDARYQRTLHLAGMKLVTALGAQGRFDDIHTQLWHDKARTRLSTCFDEGANPCDDALIGQTSIGAFLEEDARIRPWLRVVAGVRTDLYEFNVQDQKPPPATPQQVGTDNPPTTGLAQRSIINPKLQVVLKPLPFWDIYLDGGGGFHSNDARAVIAAGGSGALPRAWGGEVGSRVLLFDRLDLAAAVWDLHLQSEEVFDADEDTTSAAGPTNRYGLDLEARWAILPWLWADGDLALAHAVYTQDPGNANAVALAPTVTSTAGITALHPDGYRGRLGTRFVGTRCATEDCSLKAQGYTLFDLSLGYRRSFWEIDGVIENLTDAKWMEAQFATTYQLRGPGLPQYNQTSPDTNIAFTPGNPRNGRVIVSLFF